MKEFLGDNFLLTNEVAERLYHEYAAPLPIIDYHNHLSPADIANDRQYTNITKAWLEGDHYKWRAMRANGVDEAYITGAASDADKFQKWASTVPYTLRNPLYHWTHLELRRYFGITDLLNADTASKIYDQASQALQSPERSCRGLLEMKSVKALCTTDDPIDGLEHHHAIAQQGVPVKVLPTFRPEQAILVSNPDYLDRLGDVCDIQIQTAGDLIEALSKRVDYFHDHGCRLADISFERLPILTDASRAEKSFASFRQGNDITPEERENTQAYLLIEVCKLYHARGWAQQFHIGVLRNTNSRAHKLLGGDAGFDTMGDALQAHALLQLLDKLEQTDQLAKTILYNLNPRDNDLFATVTGNFQKDTPGKIQFGSGWWFLDQKTGIENQINSLSSMGLLSRFIGMLTDSRSFLSFPRHEYFRRIFCNLIGKDVVEGELPNDMEMIGKLVSDVCYHNTNNYLNLGLPTNP